MRQKNKNFTDEQNDILDVVIGCKEEADHARTSRLMTNRKNFDIYHLKQDFTHKLKNQSQEFLPRQALAVEQIAQFLHQGVVEPGAFFSVEVMRGVKNPIFTSDEVRNLLTYQLEKANFYNFILDGIKSALLGSLLIAKVHGEYVPKPRFFTRKSAQSGETKLYRAKDKAWQLKLDLIRQKDWYPDPTAEKLYRVQRIEMDLWKVLEMAERYPESFDPEHLEMLKGSVKGTSNIDEFERARETGQNLTNQAYRKRVVLHEYWGKLVSPETGEVLHERAVCMVANETYLIMPPQDYPNWMNEDPFVATPLVRVPWSEWHRALMDAPSAINQALNEIFNLILDGGIQSVFGIKQLREYWLEDPSQVSDGVTPGVTLSVNPACPPGGKVLERVDTGGLSAEGANTFDMASREFNASALTNDLRLGGMPNRAVKATEVVEASQSITSIFTGIGKCLETDGIEPILEKAWGQTLEHIHEIPKEDLQAILGEDRAKSILAISPKQLFAKCAGGHQFRVFGITQTLNKVRDFRKLTSMLQTIAQSPTLMEAFTHDYDFTKLLKKIMQSLDIDIDEIKHDPANAEMNKMGLAQESGQSDGNLPQGPDMQSQTPQASTGPDQGPVSQMPKTNFAAGGGGIG